MSFAAYGTTLFSTEETASKAVQGLILKAFHFGKLEPLPISQNTLLYKKQGTLDALVNPGIHGRVGTGTITLMEKLACEQILEENPALLS